MNTSSAPQSLAKELDILVDVGSGRTFITLLDDLQYLPLAKAVTERLSSKARSVVIKSAQISSASWSALSDSLLSVLGELGVRQASLIGMGAGATLAQNLALNEPKVVRSMAIVDAATRPHPSLLERVADAVESRLPFGLPLRLGLSGFNVRSYSHRFRCPLLVVSTRRASSFVRDDLRVASRLAPTAWQVDLATVSEDDEANELTETILAFQDTPVKCPQKSSNQSTSYKPVH